MSTVFVAVQCCQCSTMQVKQQKKSSNKWTCVICNQKQSLRKVFTRGLLARDVRKFVQGFNMSRQIQDSQSPSTSKHEEIPPQEFVNYPKIRSDWSEYLMDEPKQQTQNTEPDSDGEIEITTELPKEMFKKPRLQIIPSSSAGGDSRKTAEVNELFKSKFTKRKGNLIQQQELVVSKNGKQVIPEKVSKWSNYLDAEMEEMFGRGKGFTNLKSKAWMDSGAFQSVLEGEKVIEAVHPDFM